MLNAWDQSCRKRSNRSLPDATKSFRSGEEWLLPTGASVGTAGIAEAASQHPNPIHQCSHDVVNSDAWMENRPCEAPHGDTSRVASMVLIGLALFLTFFVMQPVMNDAWTTGILPLSEGRVGELEGLRLASEPFRRFMTANLRPADLQLFLDIAHLPSPATADDTPWRALVPAFLVGELRRAFEMGFLLFLPFMIIDMVVASVLMSLGMMMLPPSVVSLPFKLIFFVMVDGWRLVSGSLVQSFNATGQ